MAAVSEGEIEALVARGAFDAAATAMIERYGSELFGFLVNVLGSEHDASDVFSQVGEDLWRGLPAFRQSCSARTWLYTLARNAAANFRRSPWQRRDSLTGDSAFDAALQGARTPTPPWHRTDVKDKWRELRAALSDEDRTLLALRVDRGFAWEDVARVTLAKSDAEPAVVAREAARLRKRFQTLKLELRERAQEAGLLDDPG